MNRFKPLYAYLTLAALAAMVVGCASVIPVGGKMQTADLTFEEAEQIQIRAETKEQRKELLERRKKLYDDALRRYLAIVEAKPEGKYGQRAHAQAAVIYKKRYDWDSAVQHYQAVIDIAPTGYLASLAKSSLADIRKNRKLILEKRRIYQNYKALYDQTIAKESHDQAQAQEFNETASKALYEVAQAYETIGNYPSAIEHYERLVREFPEHKLAAQTQFKIGNLYFYKLYDYSNDGGWGAYVKVVEKFPESFEAKETGTLLKKANELLTQISQDMALIEKIKNQKAFDYLNAGRFVPTTERWIMGYSDQAVQYYQAIAQGWVKMRNYPNAVAAYRALVQHVSHQSFATADALFQIARLYQQNGQLEQAIAAYDDFFEKAAASSWRDDAVYNQAICYQAIREFRKAHRGFSDYMSLGRDKKYYREAEQYMRQFELDQDGDGYMFYQEQQAGTSDQDANDYPGAQKAQAGN